MAEFNARGAYVRSCLQKTPNRFAELVVTADHCSQFRTFGSTEIPRSDVSVVLCERFGVSIVGRDVLTFLDRHGNRIGLSFVPARTDKLLAELTRVGWPVRVERVGLFSRRVQDPSQAAVPSALVSWAPLIPWAIAVTPFVGVIFGVVAGVTRSSVLGALTPPISVIPMWLLTLALAAVDVRQERASGRPSPQREYALLGPVIYLLARTLGDSSRRRVVSWSPVALALLATILVLITTSIFTSPRNA